MAYTETNNNGLSRVQPQALLLSSRARRNATEERDRASVASMAIEVRPPSEILAEKRNKMEKRHQELKFERRAVMQEHREQVRCANMAIRARRRARSRNGFVLSRHGRPVSARVPRKRVTAMSSAVEGGGQNNVLHAAGGLTEMQISTTEQHIAIAGEAPSLIAQAVSAPLAHGAEQKQVLTHTRAHVPGAPQDERGYWDSQVQGGADSTRCASPPERVVACCPMRT